MTPEERERLAALAGAATPGPWAARCWTHEALPEGWSVDAVIDESGEEASVGDYCIEADAAFIAAAREGVPALLDALAEAEAEVERLTAVVHAKESWIDGAKVDLDDLTAERDRYRRQVEAVRALHRRVEVHVSASSDPAHVPHAQQRCAYCADRTYGDPMVIAAWPCATIRAIDGAS